MLISPVQRDSYVALPGCSALRAVLALQPAGPGFSTTTFNLGHLGAAEAGSKECPVPGDHEKGHPMPAIGAHRQRLLLATRRITTIKVHLMALAALLSATSLLGEPSSTYIDAAKIRGMRKDSVLKLLHADSRWTSVNYDSQERTIDLVANDGVTAFIAFSGGTPHNIGLNFHRSGLPLSPSLLRAFGLTAPPAPYSTSMSLVWKTGFGPYKNASIMIGGGGNAIVMLFFKPPTD